MSHVCLYIEGGRGLVAPFKDFIEKAVPGARHAMQITLCAGRDDAVHDFLLGISKKPFLSHILLIDSEGPDDGRLFESLRRTREWTKRNPDSVSGDQVFWMVQLMEAWFLADRDALRKYYGSGLNENSLIGNPKVEEIPKLDVLDSLKNATRDTSKGKYLKGAHAARLLGYLNPACVRSVAPNFERLLPGIQDLIGP